jgi:hypothetical protein
MILGKENPLDRGLSDERAPSRLWAIMNKFRLARLASDVRAEARGVGRGRDREGAQSTLDLLSPRV